MKILKVICCVLVCSCFVCLNARPTKASRTTKVHYGEMLEFFSANTRGERVQPDFQSEESKELRSTASVGLEENLSTKKNVEVKPGESMFFHHSNSSIPQFTKIPPLDMQKVSTKRLYDDSRVKLVIIMDDIANISQLSKVQDLKLNITPSLFPRTKYSPYTPHIASNLDNYIVHFPLEAINFYQEHLAPVLVGTSAERLRAIFAKIKNDFPNLHYINNHTGSKYTSSMKDMQILLGVLDEFGIKFIDSMTSGYSVSSRISRQNGILIMQRDTFLDNVANEAKILKQIQEVIDIAKYNGYAIAICHPYPQTFNALRQAKKGILKEVQIVTPAELEKYLGEMGVVFYKNPITSHTR